MKVKFWGTRGSLPTPMTTDQFRVKAKRLLMKAANVDLSNEKAVDAYLDSRPFPDAMTFGGNTPCIEIKEGKSQVIMDCGSGLFQLGRSMMKSGIEPGTRIDIIQTHTHWDHLMGFPFFGPAYTSGTDIHIHGIHPNLKTRFEQQMDLIHFPITMEDMSARIEFHQHECGEDFSIGPFTIGSKDLNHPGGSYSYRITSGEKAVVYATDGEYKEPTDDVFTPFVTFFKDVDILIFDAMYPTLEKVIERENFGHSTPVIGIGLALSAGVKKLVLFHHDPECNDTQIAQSLAEAKAFVSAKETKSEMHLDIVASYDGLQLEV